MTSPSAIVLKAHLYWIINGNVYSFTKKQACFEEKSPPNQIYCYFYWPEYINSWFEKYWRFMKIFIGSTASSYSFVKLREKKTMNISSKQNWYMGSRTNTHHMDVHIRKMYPVDHVSQQGQFNHASPTRPIFFWLLNRKM